MEFKEASEARNTIVSGSRDEFNLVIRAVRAEQHNKAIEDRRDHDGSSYSDSYGRLALKLAVTLEPQQNEAETVERCIELNFSEVQNAQLSLANAADAVEGAIALYGRTDEATTALAAAYRGLAEHWEAPAREAEMRAIRG